MSQDLAITLRVQRFLQDHPPFSFCKAEELASLVQHIEVQVVRKGQILFNKGDRPSSCFYLVKKGAIYIEEEFEQVRVLIDQCGEGDIFGIRPLIAESPYLYSASAMEDSIIYNIPFKQFQPLYSINPAVSGYMMKRFAAGLSVRETAMPQGQHLADTLSSAIVVRLNLSKPLVTARAETSIQEACQRMSERGVGSIIVLTEAGQPEGILTDRDIRNFVASGQSVEKPIKTVMSSPVQCVALDATLPEIQLTMMETGFHHLCVTEDGSPASEAKGMVTEHDILFAHSSDPVVLIKEIKHAKSMEQLADLRAKCGEMAHIFIDDELNPTLPLNLNDRLIRAIFRKCIDLILENHSDHSDLKLSDFAFFSMGSLSRGEQILPTDQDNGLIIADHLGEQYDKMLNFGKEINKALDTLGYEFCPADTMAGDKRWCMTLSDFKKQAQHWIHAPGPKEVMLTSTFFDFRFEYGNENLASELRDSIAEEISEDAVYLRFMAQQSIKFPPPLSFFRKLLVENDGEHKDQFDIKLKGLAPLSDAARVLALAGGYLETSSTVDRFDFLKTNDPGNIDLYDKAQKAYLYLLQVRTRFALRSGDSGRYIPIEDLSKLEKIQLRESFQPARRLQDMIHRRFKLGYL